MKKETLDWTLAEKRLSDCMKSYAKRGPAFSYSLSQTLKNLHSRFLQGERTAKLYDRIMVFRCPE